MSRPYAAAPSDEYIADLLAGALVLMPLLENAHYTAPVRPAGETGAALRGSRSSGPDAAARTEPVGRFMTKCKRARDLRRVESKYRAQASCTRPYEASATTESSAYQLQRKHLH